MLIILLLTLAGIRLPLRSAWKWDGRWRIAAAVPSVVMGFAIQRMLQPHSDVALVRGTRLPAVSVEQSQHLASMRAAQTGELRDELGQVSSQ